jgi:hypothetical protein
MAMVLVSARGALAQGSLEPPKFQPAPVSPAAPAAVKSSLEADPFEQEGAAPAAKTAPAAKATAAKTGAATAPAAAPAAPVTTPTPATTTPPAATTTTTDRSATTTTPATPSGTAPTGLPSLVPEPSAPPAVTAPAVAPASVPPSPPAPAPSTSRPGGATSALEPMGTRGVSQYEDMQPGPDPSVARRATEPRPREDPGIALQAGGGIMNFGSSQMQELTSAGGYWDVRVIGGLRRVFAFEAAYVGTANPVTAPGVLEGSSLVGHGAEGDLRLNLPLVTSDGAYFIPYGVAGLGWQHYRIVNGATTGAMLAQNDDVLVVPVGGGLTIGYRHMYLDARFTYRFSQYDDLLTASDQSDGQLRQWSFGGNFGWAF